jgi:hypothetical protein
MAGVRSIQIGAARITTRLAPIIESLNDVLLMKTSADQEPEPPTT